MVFKMLPVLEKRCKYIYLNLGSVVRLTKGDLLDLLAICNSNMPETMKTSQGVLFEKHNDNVWQINDYRVDVHLKMYVEQALLLYLSSDKKYCVTKGKYLFRGKVIKIDMECMESSEG